MGALHIVVLAVGNRDGLLRTGNDVHTQALYCLLSALAWRDGVAGEEHDSLHLFTDAPQRYGLLGDAVKLERFTALMEQLLQAPVLEPFKLKLAAVQAMAEQFPQDAILFCDADTFFTASYVKLRLQLLAGGFAMHRMEYSLAQQSQSLRQSRKFLRALAAAGMLDAARERDPELVMWNSGVIGLAPDSAAAMEYALCQLQILAPLLPPHYPAEQFCVAQAMPDLATIVAAEGCVFHYWYQKAAYTLAIGNRLRLWEGWPLERMLAALREQTLVLPAPPQKLHWWEKALIAAGLRQRPVDSRGLPRP